MRIIIFTTFLLLLNHLIFAQKDQPVGWEFKLEKISENEYEVKALAKVEKDWVIYSCKTAPGGPVGTSIVLDHEIVIKESVVKEEGELLAEYSDLFEMEVSKYKTTVSFSKIIKIKEGISKISGKVNFMTCNGMQCLPPTDVPFSLEI